MREARGGLQERRVRESMPSGGESLDLTIVVPCLNEENNIVATLDTIVAAMRELPCSYEILVIDDGSTDRTAQIVESYADTRVEIPLRLHRNPKNRGLTRS